MEVLWNNASDIHSDSAHMKAHWCSFWYASGCNTSLAVSQAPQQKRTISRPVCVCRDSRRFVWAIDGWSDKRRQKAVRSPHFGLAGSERTWSLSYTSDKAGFHLTCVGDSLPSPTQMPRRRGSSECRREQSLGCPEVDVDHTRLRQSYRLQVHFDLMN